MSKTSWVDAPDYGRTTPQPWLLQDGTIVHHPKLETTPSGRRVRFENDTTGSVGVNQLNEHIHKWVNAEAIKRGTAPWMVLYQDPKDQLDATHGPGVNPDFFITQGRTRGNTVVAWYFRHATMPIMAVVIHQITASYNGITVYSSLSWRSTYPDDGETTMLASHQEDVWVQPYNNMPASQRRLWQDWIAAHAGDPQARIDLTWNSTTFSNTRAAAAEFFVRCRNTSELAQMHIPDLRDTNNISWLPLEYESTTYHSVLDQELSDFVNVAPTLKQLETAAEEFITNLRRIGVVISDLPDSAMARVMTGDLTALDVHVNVDGKNDKVDKSHKVVFNLATGTVAVTCHHSVQDQVGTAAQAYQNAKFMSELKGEEDEFLTYTRAFLQDKAERDTRDILDARASIQNDLDALVARLPSSIA